ncbi:MAG: methylisocitrate lyase [Planctomycetota bacterium]
MSTPGSKFRQAIEQESPLQIPGTINPLSALMAVQAGFRAIYLSGAGVANASYGVPDLGMTSLADVVVDINRITSIVNTPLLVDADTGWGHGLNIARTVREFIKAGAAAMHIEDQQSAKRCGHRPNKAIVETSEMVDRIHAAVDARNDPSFFIMARTDALASEGIDASIERCQRYIEAGADGIFAEAITDQNDYLKFTSSFDAPVLANMTEFGMSPLMTTTQLKEVGVQIALYPLSAFRAMNEAARRVFETIRRDGTQAEAVSFMQTRDQLYDVLDYHTYEEQMNQIIQKQNSGQS